MYKWLCYEFQVKHFKYKDCSPERFYTSQVSKYQAVWKCCCRNESVKDMLGKIVFSVCSLELNFLRKIETLFGFLSSKKEAVENADNFNFSLCKKIR